MLLPRKITRKRLLAAALGALDVFLVLCEQEQNTDLFRHARSQPQEGSKKSKTYYGSQEENAKKSFLTQILF